MTRFHDQNVDVADFDCIWRGERSNSGTQLRAVCFCPADGQLHVGAVNGRCTFCGHVLIQLPYSPERMAAFRLYGPDGVRGLDGQVLPGDERFAHYGGWAACGCQACAARRLYELAP